MLARKEWIEDEPYKPYKIYPTIERTIWDVGTDVVYTGLGCLLIVATIVGIYVG